MVVSILNNFAIIKKHKKDQNNFSNNLNVTIFNESIDNATNFLYDLNKLILD